MNEAKDHHYVPRFLLRQWMIDENLHGYCWDTRNDRLYCKRRGVNAFCYETDLFLLKDHELGRDAIETKFFSPIDDRSAIVRDKVINCGINSLSDEERSDFARFLFSLEMRMPKVVGKLKSAADEWKEALNSDPAILTAIANLGSAATPVEMWEKQRASLDDHALMLLQKLVDNSNLGPKIVNARWNVITLRPNEGTFALSDRPIIKNNGFEDDDGYWALPLDPTHLFVATPHARVMNALVRTSAQRIAKTLNPQSARQAWKYVFSIESRADEWVGKYLKFGDEHTVLDG